MKMPYNKQYIIYTRPNFAYCGILLVIIFFNVIIAGCETTKATGEILAPAVNKTVDVVTPLASEADHRVAGAVRALANTTEEGSR